MVAESSSGAFSGIGFLNPSNTGDFALLLNDAMTVGSVVQGGTLTYRFTGFEASMYEVYTYAVRPQGQATSAPIEIPKAVANNVQIVTGPMPGNAFEHLVTHSKHVVDMSANGSFSIGIVQQPGTIFPFEINGFQIIPVPEPNSVIIVASVLLYAALRRRHDY
jgi:hypothetical protein